MTFDEAIERIRGWDASPSPPGPPRSVLDIRPLDPICKASVPDTPYVIVPPLFDIDSPRIETNGIPDEELTRKMRKRFCGYSNSIATARLIAGWFREGAPYGGG